jgi:hypothetical protein
MVEALISYIALLVAIGSRAVWSIKEGQAGTEIEWPAVMGMQPSQIRGLSGATGTKREAILVQEGPSQGAW